MFKATCPLVDVAVTCLAPGLWAQRAPDASQARHFAFHRDQSVYITAFHYEHDHSKNVVNRAGIGDYLAAEQVVRKEFEKTGIVKTVDKPSDADYVFVMYVRDRAAEGLVIAPDRYRQTKPDLYRGDLDPLRDAAYARYLVGPFKVPTLGRMSAQLVQKFQAHATATK